MTPESPGFMNGPFRERGMIMKDRFDKIRRIFLKKRDILLRDKETIVSTWKEFTSWFNANEPLRKTIDRVMQSGLWIQPLIMVCVIHFMFKTNPQQLLSIKNWFVLFVLSFLPSLFIWSENLTMPSAEDAMRGKEKAMYPPIPDSLLYEKPTGILLGKDSLTQKYICKPLEEDGHVFVIGGSGSGKSSCLVIPTLLTNPAARIFAIDIKGELSFKGANYGDEHVLIFDPTDRSKYGYDPFYNLSENSSVQEILETMQTITYSLIAMPPGLKDPFWKNSARNLLLGLLIYYYRKGIRNFVDIIDEILNKPARESIEAVMNNANHNSVEYRYCVQFADLEDETLGSIVSELSNCIVTFSNDMDIRYAFKENCCKLNPLKLEEGCSIYLVIKEEKLSAYYNVLQLILNQTLSQLEKRPENSDPIIFIIDELPRLLSAGKLERLLDGARTLRSRRVCLFLITQSTEALMSAYSENEVADLISNCPYIVVLSASSSKTQKSVCDWCGKYRVRKTSWSGSGKNRRLSVSYEEKNIVEPSDLMTLKNTGEAILISPYGYGRVKKVPYYQDENLCPKQESIMRNNKIICAMKNKDSASSAK